MTQPDPKYVASSRPVNRRTAGRQPLPPPPVNPVVQERLAAAKARNRLGPPLAEQVRGAAAAQRTPLHPLAVVGGITATTSGVALFLAWLQASALLAAGGAAGLLAGLVLAWRSHRGSSALATPPAAPLFDEACLQALDRALELLAPEVPDAIAAQLTGLKHLIVRIARQGGAAVVDENFTLDDRLYMNECVRRYLPDTLQGYLTVPREQRSAQMLEGQSAVQLLESQLGLLRAELEKREARLARSAAEQMLKQQRFLKAKAGR